MRVLIVDHQDSFTFNLVHELAPVVGGRPCVVDSREIPSEWLRSSTSVPFDLLVLGPGPGHPVCQTDTGRSGDLLRSWGARIPVFGLCFGMQLVVVHFGGRVSRAHRIVHGSAVAIEHSGRGMLANIPSPASFMRYNSLVAERDLLPSQLSVEATSEGDVMAVAHRELPIWGVQFHPESVGSSSGQQLLRNVVDLARAWHETA